MLPFDSVVIIESGERVVLSVEQFANMPLQRRIECLLSRQIQFLNGSNEVDRQQALRALRQRSAGKDRR